MFEPPLPPPLFRRWMRHVAAVPKGFLRYQLLELLSDKPMSGSEIMNEIEKRTSGHWKPGPGSIYPLLAWLQDNGFTRELPTEEDGMKRYKLTDKGKMLLEEQRKMKKKFGREARWDPPFLEALWLHMPPEKSVQLQESLKRLFVAFLDLRSGLEENLSDQIIEELRKIIDESAERLEDLNKKLEKRD